MFFKESSCYEFMFSLWTPLPLELSDEISYWAVTVTLSCNSCRAPRAPQQYLMIVGRGSFLGQQHETKIPQSVWGFCKLHINSSPSAGVFKHLKSVHPPHLAKGWSNLFATKASQTYWWKFGLSGLADLIASHALAINPSRCAAQPVQELESNVDVFFLPVLEGEI